MRILLKNGGKVNGHIFSRIGLNDEPTSRTGDILKFIEAHPEYQDGSYRIEEVDTTVPWTIAVEITDGSHGEHREFIKYNLDYRYSVYDKQINYYLPSGHCASLKDWAKCNGKCCGYDWIKPSAITSLYMGDPF